MSGRTFVDTSVLIYAHDADAGMRHQRAAEVLFQLWNDQSGVVSPQVLQEFYVNVTRKISRPVTKRAARSVVSAYSAWCVDTTPCDIATAFRIEDEHRIGFWDALIVASALKSGARRILSEDLNAGQKIAGLTIENPFRSSQ